MPSVFVSSTVPLYGLKEEPLYDILVLAYVNNRCITAPP